MIELPEDELRELADILESGELRTLRNRFDAAREVRQPLHRFTDRVWFFPFGIAPDPRHVVQVFVNGFMIHEGMEFRMVRVGNAHPLYVVVMDRALRQDEVVQAFYRAVPLETP